MSESGRRLFELLPEVYRTRDNAVRDSNGKITEPGDQAKYLDACGQLLDRIKATLKQRLDDCHPDTCQDWLLPYFADLLDVRLVSPDADGQREEIAHAVAWRKGKGTLSVAEAIAEAVGQIEGELQEGWKRVAITPRLGMPLLPATALGASKYIDMDKATPSGIARHPGLPAATVDLRQASRAILLDGDSNPAAKKMGSKWWYQANPHGNPCHPGSFDDVSRRTVDIRTQDWQQGHYHPKQLLIYMPPPDGFFATGENIGWADVKFEKNTEDGVWEYGDVDGPMQNITTIDSIVLDSDKTYRLINVQLCCDEFTVTQGRLELLRVAASKVVVNNADTEKPVLKATDCLFNELDVSGLCQLEYCTVLGSADCQHYLQASDCIFCGGVQVNPQPNIPLGTAPSINCIRYSRVPTSLLGNIASTRTCTDARPVFFSEDYADPKAAKGCGMLHPASPEAIRFGADDGGEMGAYHHKLYCLSQAAVIDKLMDYLPLGIEPVLIPDIQLGCFREQAATESETNGSDDNGGTE